jgi:hypothetical protein
MKAFIERYADKIVGVISSFDRVVITGTILDICYADAMSRHLRSKSIRIFDYTRFAEPLREEIRKNAEEIAADSGLEIEFIRSKNFRQDDRIDEIIARRGNHPGLVHIFSVMERCPSFKPWHDKATGKTFLKYTQAKCLHYYFYFIDRDLGLCYVRVPTWAPFRVQIYFNGHNQLALKMDKLGIGYTQIDNSFLAIDDFTKAQELADVIDVGWLQKRLNKFAERFCPVIRHFSSGYYWSLMQLEYATDIVFKSQEDLQPIYQHIVRTAVHAVKADNIATFLGRKLNGNYQGEMGNRFHTRIQGTRIRHHMGHVSIKMYDKFGIVLRIEVTANDVSFFKHHRRVEHRDGTSEMKPAPVRKFIYSLPVMSELMKAANRRYIDFVAAIDDRSAAIKDLDAVSRPASDGNRTFRGFNLFHGDDLDLFLAIARGEFMISGCRNKNLRGLLNKTGAQVSRMLKRLKTHGLIKKIRRTYKYYLTTLGTRLVTTALKLREMFIIPSLAGPQPPSVQNS